MKKNINIILVNIIAVILIIFLMNFLFYAVQYNRIYAEINLKKIYKHYIEFLKRDISYQDTYNDTITAEDFRKTENINSKNGNIIIFGCSYAAGLFLKDNQTLSYKLGRLTDKAVYNRAKSGWGVQHTLFQLKNNDFYSIVPNADYIIYVYISNHLHRLKTPVDAANNSCYSVFYKIKNNKFILKKRNFFTDKIVIHHYIYNKLVWNFLNRIKKFNLYEAKLFNKYIIEAKNEAEKRWGKNIKFIIVLYNHLENKELEEELRSQGFYLLTSDDFKIDLNQTEYQISQKNMHPNEAAWDIVAPLIADKINTKQF